MMSGIMMGGIMLSEIMLSAVSPWSYLKTKDLLLNVFYVWINLRGSVVDRELDISKTIVINKLQTCLSKVEQ